MPREFQNFSDDMASGTDKIASGLERVRGAADDADRSHGNLSRTQMSATGTAATFQKSMMDVQRSLHLVGVMGTRAGRGVMATDKSVRTLATSFGNLSSESRGAFSDLKVVGDGVAGLAVDLDGLYGSLGDVVEGISDVSGSKLAVGVDFSQMVLGQEALKSFQETSDKVEVPEWKSEFINRLREDMGLAQIEIEKMRAGIAAVDTEVVVQLEVDIARMEAISDYVGQVEGAGAEAAKAAAETDDLERAMSRLEETSSGLRADILKGARAAEEGARASKEWSGEIDKAQSVVDIAKKRFQEGRQEAESFADGLGASTGVMIGAGVAAVYLAGKLADLTDRFLDSRLEISSFNVEMAALERQMAGDFVGNFDELRDELVLTRQQGQAFFETMRDAQATGIVTADALVDAAGKLREAFGGDQIERLREYVGLLESIPTIETDLSVTASLDDQTSALFALAEQGKIQSVIDLQSAGLFGGIEAEVTTDTDVGLLNSAQKTEKTVQDMTDFLKETLFPSFSPQFAAMAKGVATTAGAVTAGFVGLGLLSRLLSGKLVRAQNRTTQVLIGGGGTGDVDDLVREAAYLTDRTGSRTKGAIGKKALTDTVKKGGGGRTKRAVAAGTGAVIGGAIVETAGRSERVVSALKLFADKLKSGSKVVGRFGSKFAKAGGVGGVAFAAAGIAAWGAAKMFDSAGNKTAAAGTRLAGSLSSAVGTIATFTSIGSMVIPGVGTALGAVAGTAIVLGTQLDVLADSADSFGSDLSGMVEVAGKPIPRFSGEVRLAGDVLSRLAIGLRSLDDVVDDEKAELKALASTYFELNVMSLKLMTGIQQTELLYRFLNRGSKEYRAELGRATGSAEDFRGNVDKLVEAGAALDRARAGEMRARTESVFALRRQMNRMDKIFDGPTFALERFGSEVSKVRLESLGKIGPVAETLESTVNGAMRAFQREFERVTSVNNKARKRILEDEAMGAKERAVALDDVAKRDIEAREKFVDSVGVAAQAMLEVPSIMSAQLRQEIRLADLDFRLDSGSVDISTIVDTLGSSWSEQISMLSKLSSQRVEAEDNVAKAEKDLDKARKAIAKTIVESSEERKKKFIDDGVATIEGGEVKIDASKAKDVLKTVRGEIADLEAEVGRLKEVMPEATFGEVLRAMDEAGRGIQKNHKQAEELANQIAGFNKEISDAGGEGSGDEKAVEAAEKRRKAMERLEAVNENIVTLEENSVKAVDSLVEMLGHSALKTESEVQLRKRATNFLAAAAADGETVLGFMKMDAKQKGEVARTGQALSEVTGRANEYQVETVKRTTKMLDDARKMESDYDGLASAHENGSTALTNQRDVVNKWKESSEKSFLDLEKLVQATGKAVAAQERASSNADLMQRFAASTGSGIAAFGETIGAQIDLFAANFEQWKEKMVEVEKMATDAANETAKARDKLEEAQMAAAKAPDNEASAKAVKSAQEAVKVMEAAEGRVAMGVAKINEQMTQAFEALPDVGEIFEKILGVSETDFPGQRIGAELDLSDARASFAEFSDDFAMIARETTDLGIAASNERLAHEKKAILEGSRRAREALEKRIGIEAERDGLTPAEVAQKTAEGERLIQATEQAKMAEKESGHKQKVVDLAQRESDIKNRSLDMDMEAVDVQIDFLSEIGGSISTIIGLQQQGVAIEEQKLMLAEQNLQRVQDAEIGGAKLQEAELAVIKQRVAVERKALGAQKDVFEKILGAAFGELRDVGASRRRGSDVGLLGRDRTRVQTRSGIFARAEGGVKTIAERAAGLQLARLEAKFGAGGAGGVAGAVPGVNEAPQRLAIEGQVERGLRKVGGGGIAGFGQRTETAAGVRSVGEARALPVRADVKVEVNVKFDNRMFRDQVTRIAVESLSNAESIKTLDKRYLTDSLT